MPRSSLVQTVTGKRLNLNGSMTCSGKTVEGRLLPANDAVAGTVGVALTLQALNVNCAQPAGNVQVTGLTRWTERHWDGRRQRS